MWLVRCNEQLGKLNRVGVDIVTAPRCCWLAGFELGWSHGSREPEGSRWRYEVILEVAGCPCDMRPVGRTSQPDAFCRVAVFGDHAPPVPAAGAAAAEAELPAAEATAATRWLGRHTRPQDVPMRW